MLASGALMGVCLGQSRTFCFTISPCRWPTCEVTAETMFSSIAVIRTVSTTLNWTSVDFSVVETVRITAIDENMVSAVTSHVGQRHGLIVKQKVRDCPRHTPIKAPLANMRSHGRNHVFV